MSLKVDIDADLKQALLSGDKEKATTLRGLKAAILEVEIASGSREQGLSDEEVEKVISREIKKRRESVALYEQNDRLELAKIEQAEIEAISCYLPKQLDESELETIIEAEVSSFGAADIKDMGKIIGAVKSKVGNSADGALVARLVKEKLS